MNCFRVLRMSSQVEVALLISRLLHDLRATYIVIPMLLRKYEKLVYTFYICLY